MTYDVTFGSNAISQYGFYLEDADLGSPEPQTAYVEVPGRNGALDMSEAITGYPTYNNRTLTFTLVMDGTIEDIETAKDQFFTDNHGKTMEILSLIHI